MPKKIVERPNGTLRVINECEGPTLTEQHHREMVNINNIVAKARKGLLPVNTRVAPNYGDFSSGMDFTEMMQRVKDAEADMAALPSDIRKRFKNNPAALIDFLADEKNREEAYDLGLLVKPGAEPLVDGPPVPEPEALPPESPPAET